MGFAQIQSFTQSFVKAISAIIEAEVTVVDSNHIRVAASSFYEDEVGSKVLHSDLFSSVMQEGKPEIIENIRDSEICRACAKKSVCKELANMAYPIFLNGRVEGVISVIAFSEEQKQNFIANIDKLETFLKYMSMLLESKLVSAEANLSLERQINEIILRDNEGNGFNAIISRNRQMLELIRTAKKIARGSSSVMILGESGTGKELLARAIHASGSRADKLLISVNCAAIPESLAESELFGYEEGAFTGAKKGGKIGKFELAHKSTIFFDEIGDMSPAIQAKLLRALQEGCIERVGGKTTIPVDVRVICATHKNLPQMVADRTFREDLYYRLNVIPLTIMPLRDRREDIPLLAAAFTARYGKKLHKGNPVLEEPLVELLTGYDWPGNIRELKNIIEYMVNMSDGNTLGISDLPPRLRLVEYSQKPAGRPLAEMVDEYEKKLLKQYLPKAATTREKLETAEILCVSRATLYRKLSKYGLLDSADSQY